MRVISLVSLWRLGAVIVLAGLTSGTLLAASFRVVDGEVQIQRGDQFLRPVVGTRLREGDEVRTAINAEVMLAFEDGARMAIRPESVVRFVELRLQGVPERRRKTVRTSKGALRYLSGRYGKRQHIAFETATATIGVRGTDIEILVLEDPTDANAAGTYLKVNKGAATLQALDGTQVDVDPGELAYGGEPDLMPRGPGGVKRPAGRRLETAAMGVFKGSKLDGLFK